MSHNKKIVFLIVGAIILSVLLFFAPKVILKKEESPIAKNSGQTLSFDTYLKLAVSNLEADNKTHYLNLLNLKKHDSLILFWDKLKRPDVSSYFLEKIAKEKNTSTDWLRAGKKYFNSVQFTQDKSEMPVLFSLSLNCFNTSLQLDPNNNEAKIYKASCLVEEGSDPMQGITLLKEVEKTDSNNVQLQLSFAFFSLKSEQLDKAVYRFNKVLKIDSAYIEAYLHLADIFEKQGKTNETILMLNNYLKRTTDETTKIEIKKYINQIKSNINN